MRSRYSTVSTVPARWCLGADTLCCIRSRADFGLALAALILLAFWKISPVIVVAFSAIGGWLIASVFATGGIF
jgi:hypothetical protein